MSKVIVRKQSLMRNFLNIPPEQSKNVKLNILYRCLKNSETLGEIELFKKVCLKSSIFFYKIFSTDL